MNESKENNVINLINHLKKSPVLNALKDKVEQIAVQTASLRHEPIGLDDLVSKLSNDTDKEILKIIKHENLNFIGGELIVLGTSKKIDCFSLDLKLFFQNNKDEVILKEKHKELEFSILDETSQKELIEKKSITYEVNEPNQE